MKHKCIQHYIFLFFILWSVTCIKRISQHRQQRKLSPAPRRLLGGPDEKEMEAERGLAASRNNAILTSMNDRNAQIKKIKLLVAQFKDLIQDTEIDVETESQRLNVLIMNANS